MITGTLQGILIHSKIYMLPAMYEKEALECLGNMYNAWHFWAKYKMSKLF
jgi:hypothetical protein